MRIDARTVIMVVATISPFAGYLALRAAIDLKNPAVTLYERPPATASTSPAKDAAVPPPPLVSAKQSPDGYWHVGFEELASFFLPVPSPEAQESADLTEKIPAAIKELDRKPVCIAGYMLPIKLENGLATEFLIIRSPLVCCYGVAPRMNEWVLATMKPPGAKSQMDVPLDFYGALRVGAVFEQKMLVGIYRLDCEKISSRR